MKSECAFDAVMTRLKAAAGASNDRRLAEIMGLSGSGYANLKKRDSIPFEKAITLAISLKVNIHWLFTGEGECWRSQMESSSLVTCDPRAKKIIALLPDLTERQLNQIEWTLDDYHALNRAFSQLNVLQQQIEETPPDKCE